MELCLGTVQLGIKYGVASTSRPSETECIKILKYAFDKGITTFDTALAYGDSQKIIAKSGIPREHIRIISKISPQKDTHHYTHLKNQLEQCLTQLNTTYLDGLLFHNAAFVHDTDALQALEKLKQEGYVRCVGISTYTPQEFSGAISSAYTDIIQIPYNILDRRLDDLFVNGKEIHARSAFLQGLLLMDKAPLHLKEAQVYLDKITEICLKNGISKIAYLLNFVKIRRQIHKLVFGVDNLLQLKEIVTAFNTPVDESLFLDFYNIDEGIINPSLWSKK